MGLDSLVAVVAGVLVSLGGGAVIIFSLSSWLGKLWADRLMQKERHGHALELEQLRNALKLTSEEQLASLRTQLDITREAHVREQLDRVLIYRAVVDLISEIMAKIQMILTGTRSPLTPDELYSFELQRLRVHGYLAMHAPQNVMDAHDAMSDRILALLYNRQSLTWEEARELALGFLNAIRADIGIRPEPVEYRGSR